MESVVVEMGLNMMRREQSVVIRRADIERIHDYARKNCCPRDFLLFRLPMKIGLRTGEICNLRIENINFSDKSFYVLDSKKKTLFPLPLDILTLQMIQDLIGLRTQGYVFKQEGTWKYVRGDKPLTRARVWRIIREIAKKADVPDFNPRMLRHYFAAHWALVEKKSLLSLQRILRHRSLETTSIYLARLTFWEDLQKEYDDVKNEQIQESSNGIAKFEVEPTSKHSTIILPNSASSQTICTECKIQRFCKFAPLPSCVESCKGFVKAEIVQIQRPS